MADPSAWNSLEVTKLIVGALTPLTVALLGIRVARATRRLEASQWVNQKLIEKRIDLLEEILPLPQRPVLLLRMDWELERAISGRCDPTQTRTGQSILCQPAFFSASTITAYQEFTRILFKTHAAPGVDALLRTTIESHDGSRMKAYPGAWKPEWTAMFAEDKGAGKSRSHKSPIPSPDTDPKLRDRHSKGHQMIIQWCCKGIQDLPERRFALSSTDPTGLRCRYWFNFDPRPLSYLRGIDPSNRARPKPPCQPL